MNILLIIIIAFGIISGLAVLLGTVMSRCDRPQPATTRTYEFFADPGVAAYLPDVVLDDPAHDGHTLSQAAQTNHQNRERPR